MERRRDEPAFPRDHRHEGHNGMTLRDYFAAHALTGLCAFPGRAGENNHPEDFARWSYSLSDAMLAARGAQ